MPHSKKKKKNFANRVVSAINEMIKKRRKHTLAGDSNQGDDGTTYTSGGE